MISGNKDDTFIIVTDLVVHGVLLSEMKVHLLAKDKKPITNLWVVLTGLEKTNFHSASLFKSA